MSNTETPTAAGAVLEGMWEDVVQRGRHFAGKRVLVMVLAEDPAVAPSLDEQERLLDDLAKRHAHVPALPEDAYNRESIYSDHD